MTDADLCRASRWTDPPRWAAELTRTRHTHQRVADRRPCGRPRVVSAASHRLRRPVPMSDRWLAVGDAALGVDPLASSGILRALVTGHAGGLAMAHWLFGRPEPVRDYERWLDAEFDHYLTQRRRYYALERRWPDAPFWRRRHATATPSRP
jgi:flavin-dependent dehydrogenase